MKNLNWLIDTTDATKWAAEFVRVHGGDEGLMLAWFANAIETGRRAGEINEREKQTPEQHAAELRAWGAQP